MDHGVVACIEFRIIISPRMNTADFIYADVNVHADDVVGELMMVAVCFILYVKLARL